MKKTTNSIDITGLSKEELQDLTKASEARLAEIKAQEDKVLLEENGRHLDKLRKYKDILMELIEHGRTSCSDDNIANGYSMTKEAARCNKCHLIEILNGEWGDEFAVSLKVEIYKVL